MVVGRRVLEIETPTFTNSRTGDDNFGSIERKDLFEWVLELIFQNIWNQTDDQDWTDSKFEFKSVFAQNDKMRCREGEKSGISLPFFVHLSLLLS